MTSANVSQTVMTTTSCGRGTNIMHVTARCLRDGQTYTDGGGEGQTLETRCRDRHGDTGESVSVCARHCVHPPATADCRCRYIHTCAGLSRETGRDACRRCPASNAYHDDSTAFDIENYISVQTGFDSFLISVQSKQTPHGYS